MILHNERAVNELIAALDPRLDPRIYGFVSVAHATRAAVSSPLDEIVGVASVEEHGTTTYVVDHDAAKRAGLVPRFPCRRLDLGLDTPLAAVGFLAHILSALANLGIAVNPMAGFHRDTLFVPVDAADAALRALEDMAHAARQKHAGYTVNLAAHEVLQFWFGTLRAGFADAVHRKRWFTFDAAFDTVVRSHFDATIADALDGKLDNWLDAARGRLAFIVVTDQFTRNAHRGTANAFAGDALALAAAREGVRIGADTSLGCDERAFFYLPFEHSESVVDQHTSVGLFTKLRDDSPRGKRRDTSNSLRYALQHRDIVLRFRRFPHRNAALGRESTAEEIDFLATASRFGQS